MTGSSWVTVATFDTAHHARLARTLLDAADIPTRLADDHLVDAMPYYAVAVGGVKLRVPEADVPDAEAVLASVEPASETPRRPGMWALVVLVGGPVALVTAWIAAVATRPRGGVR
ncbi:MAG: DUF2007 domain-containing protein [Bacteroidota bacterium]